MLTPIHPKYGNHTTNSLVAKINSVDCRNYGNYVSYLAPSSHFIL